ncbi:hypothetical protein V6M85_05150 [Sulfolobus tengchongensis]|uniref:DUF1641 domain-containing protein n=1 Tax=Sulfolobus tengchongensis TaxID=207809 RepID=A0AAX4L5E4_9CREN
MSLVELNIIDELLKDEKLNSLNKLLDILNDINKLGILDVIKGIAEDEKTIGKIAEILTGDAVLSLLVNREKIVKNLSLLLDDDTIYNLNYILSFVDKVRNKGILDPIVGLLEDEELLGKLINGIINDFTLNLISNWNEIVKDLSRIDLKNFKYYTLLVSATGEALKTENIKTNY